jgi:predicted N-acyltransferase
MSTGELFTAEQQGQVPAWWARLSAGHPLSSDPRWLDLFARSRGEPPSWWFGAGRSAGPEVGLRGTVVDAGIRKSMNPYRWLFERTAYHDGEPLDPATAPAPADWFPALLCAYPGLAAYPVGAGDDPELVATLLAGIVDWAAGRRIRTVVVGFVQPELEAFAGPAAAAGFRALPVATRANLPLAGRTAAQVFASFSAQQRNNLRRLRRKLDARGVRVVELDRPLDRLDRLVELRCEHFRQHGKPPDPAEERSWLGPLLSTFGSRVTVFGAVDGSGLGGFSLFVDDGQWWNAFAVARLDPDVYFELMYHAPIEHAAARGLAEISFGYGTGEAKRRRGCELVSVPAWYHGVRSPVRDWLAARP